MNEVEARLSLHGIANRGGADVKLFAEGFDEGCDVGRPQITDEIDVDRRTDRSVKRACDAAAHVVPDAEPAKGLGHGSQGGDQVIAVVHALRSCRQRRTLAAISPP